MFARIRVALTLAVLALVFGVAPALDAAAAKPAAKKPPTRAASRPGSAERRAATQAKQWMAHLNARERVAQLVMTPVYGDSPNARSKEYRDYVSRIVTLKVGGLVLLNRVRDGFAQKAEPVVAAAFLNRMQRLSKIPLIVAADAERGASMRMLHTTPFPYLMAFGAGGDVTATRALGRATAREARALGVQWILAPDADVNNNPDNPVINLRSFGEDPNAVAAHVRAFIEGAHSDPANPVVVTAKHFPGHGDTDVDSHLDLPRLTASRERIDQVELVPFRAAIAAGVDSIMSAHIEAPALDSKPGPATLSTAVLTGLLREDLKFNGIIATDSLQMQGVTKLYGPGEACVRAVLAGADLLLDPADPKECINAVVAAMKGKRIEQSRVNASVLKLLTAKARAGLAKKKLVDLEAIPDSLDTPEDQELASSVAEHALTLLRNTPDANGVAPLPLAQPERACWFVLANGRFSTQGRDFVETVKQHTHPAQVTLLDPQLPMSEFEGLAAQARGGCGTIVVATYVTHVTLPGNYPALMEKLGTTGRPIALLSLGSPYLLRTYPNVQAYLNAFGAVPAAETAVVRAVLGEIGVSGRMPVSIPGLARLGDGLRLETRGSKK